MTPNKLVLACALALAAPAFAQSPTTQMPEGTRDIHLSLIAALVPVTQGKGTMRALVLPSASILWSNGVFLAPGELGMQMSEDPTLAYGPLLHYGSKSRRADDPQDKIRLGVEAGGFARYRLAHNINLQSALLYGGGDNQGGLQLNLGASYALLLSSHQSLSLALGATLANRNYMQSYFGVDPAQALRGHRPVYDAGGGLKDISAALSWDAQLSNKFDLNSGIRLSRLANNAASSPLVESRHNAALWTALSYHY
jgi:outer membrane protein